MSRLVAGAKLKADEVRAYSEDGAGHTTQVESLAVGVPRQWRQVEIESIDMFELAPFYLMIAAQEKAAALIADAEQRAHEIRATAQHEGEAAGRERGKQDLLPALVALADASQTLIVFEQQLIARYTPQLVQLALEIAEKIIARALVADPAIVAAVLERAKNEVGYAKQLRICLNPEDLDILKQLRPDLLRAEGVNGRTLEVVSAADIARGGCRLETEAGIVDATIPTQLDELGRHLLRDAHVGAPS